MAFYPTNLPRVLLDESTHAAPALSSTKNNRQLQMSNKDKGTQRCEQIGLNLTREAK